MSALIKKVSIDLDGTVYDAIQKICSLYNDDYQYYDGFKYVNPVDVQTWDFEELGLIDRNGINTYFCQPRFFVNLRIFNCASWIIGLLSHDYKIQFVSKGDPPNLKLKKQWIKEHFPYGELIGIQAEASKGSVDLSDSILIDDVSQNLNESNARLKICFGEIYPWNEDWNGIRCFNWSEVYGVVKEVNN